MVKNIFGLVLAVLIASAEIVTAQVSTSAVPFLLIAPNSRASGMGEAGVALADDASASFWNPAGLAFQQGSELSISHANWLPAFQLSDLFIDYLVYRRDMPELDGTVAASLTYLNLGEFNRTENDPTVLETFKAYEFALTVGYATKLSEGLGVGINGRFIHSRLAPFGTAEEKGRGIASGFSFDVGLMYRPRSLMIPFTDLDMGNRFSLGVNLSNVGPALTYIDKAQADPLPTNFRFGLGYKIIDGDFNNLTAILDVSKLLVAKKDDGTSEPFYKAIFTAWADKPFKQELREFVTGLGFEYWYGSPRWVALRAGYFYEDPQFGNRKFLTFGAGVRYDIYGFDFSYISTFEEQHPLGETLRFTLLISWGGAAI
ncbi:MAG: type IX secretion system outer membrane channel protein PorV [Ignavibacteriales bacterium]|nr:type IX secretion system outer membrane channel protein PorV [Ignavibacteriales bacterium]